VTGGWIKLYEKFKHLYISPGIMMIKSRRTRWASGVKHMREKRNAYKILVKELE
jgi:hypothetical protein